MRADCQGMPNLFSDLPVEIFFVRQGINIGVDPKCHVGFLAEPHGSSTDLPEFWLRFDIELVDVTLQGELDFCNGLRNA